MLNVVAGYWFYGAAEQRRFEPSADEGTSFQAGSEGVDTLTLWHEAGGELPAGAGSPSQVGEGKKEKPRTPAEDAPVDGSIPAEARCSMAGPFDRVQVERLVAALDESDIEYNVTGRDEITREDFWLIIPPRKTPQAAETLLEELRSRGIDSYLITEGEYQGGITLGVFSERANVDNYREVLAGQGYETAVVMHREVDNKRWLVFPAGQDSTLIEYLVEDMDAGDSLWRQDGSCESEN